MIKSLILIPCIVILLFTQKVGAVDHPELHAFPPAKAGMQRFVIVLPHKERGEEDAFKVELIPGKIAMTDGVNRVNLGVEIEKHPLKGWGYSYYEIAGKGQMMSTMMGVMPGTKPIEKFVKGKPMTIRYNSRLPIVVYAPEGFSLKYRIWNTTETLTNAEPG